MTAELVTFERDEEPGSPTRGVVTLTLHPGERSVVVLDSALLRAVDATMNAIDASPPPAGFVLASEGRVFIAGANLEEIMSLSDEELHAYLEFGSRVYGRIAKMECTTVAAINGAALGGGLEIAMHCDHLIGATPPEIDGKVKNYQVGLPEAGLAICPGWGGTVLLPARMDVADAIERTAIGKPMPAEQAASAGLLEELVDGASLLERARTLAMTPKSEARAEPVSIAEPARRDAARGGLDAARGRLADTGSARAVIRCVEEGLAHGWEAALACERESLVTLRSSKEGREAIEAFFAKSGARPSASKG